MTVNSEQICLLDRRGEYGQLIRAFNSGSPRLADETSRIALAHAYAITGKFDEAWDIAAAESRTAKLDIARARSLYVLALVEQARGKLEAAESKLREAYAASQHCGDWEIAAWAHLALFRLLHGPKSSAEPLTLGEVRRTVARAAAVHVTAYLHVCVAAFEGQAGRLDESARHCDIADSILKQDPNTWIAANVHLNRAAAAVLHCDFAGATDHIRHGRELALRTGDHRMVLMFDTNAAHVEMATGRFDNARKIFTRLRESAGMTSITMLGVLDGLARLELTLGNLDACESALSDAASKLGESPGLIGSYHNKCIEITKAKLMIKRHQHADALVQLSKLASENTSIESPFSATINLLKSQALVHSKDPAGAARSLVYASRSRIGDLREVQHEYYSRVADVLGRRSPTGSKLARRAFQLAAHLGMASEHRAPAIQSADGSEPRIPNAQPLDLANSLSGLIDVAFSPHLFAEELATALNRTRFENVTVDTTNHSSPDATHIAERERIEIGTPPEVLAVSCSIPDDPLRALLLADVFRVARAALALERYKREERSRAALWPADPVESEAGVLFLSDEMQTLLANARRVAAANIPVLITGETGTGKEVLARLIHAYSPRTKAPFIPFNCTATPKEMLDSQLFGHRRGAFTGATENFQGVIRAASGGTLFLDEIGETTLDVQPKLLRFLESSEVHPIGEARPARVDVRVIAATNADLQTMVAQGRFRQDLLYRLNTVTLPVPPLRERRVEIPALATHYLNKYAAENHKGALRLAEDTIEYLVLYRWPGNIRQLANEMRRMAALAEKGAVLMPEHLSPELAASRRTVPPSQRVLEDNEVVVRTDQPMAAGVAHYERTMILRALKLCGGRLEETAAMLGLSRKGLYLKRLRYGLDGAADGPPTEAT
jgi:DNA-binding NtrC family response regulator/tetratricopeptide (TPR) repeat protein